MKQLRVEKVLFAVLVVGALMACKKSSEEGSGDTASSGDKVGVKECDEFLEKYEKCLTTSSKIPDVAKDSYKESIKSMREAWKEAAKTSAGKTGLKQGCEQSLATTKEAMKDFGCEW